MSAEFEKVALVGLHSDSRVAEPMQQVAAHLAARGVAVYAAPPAAEFLGVEAIDDDNLAEQADLMVAVGGDGTMLYAAALAGDRGVPLLGINRGRLGFLTDVSPTQMLGSLDLILDGDYRVEQRLRIDAELRTGGGDTMRASALNDVVLQRHNTGRMLDFETRVAGQFVNLHMGDGLIVATPTGSTAYALSCGGPIIEPSLAALALVPICPHTLSDRPVVIPAASDIEVRLMEREDTGAEVVVDGHLLGEISPSDVLTISLAERGISLIHPPGYDYYEILRSKLHWGRDRRKQTDGD